MDLRPIKDDLGVFDDKKDIIITHTLPASEGGIDRQVNWTTGTTRVLSKEFKTFALFSTPESREQNSVRQIFQRGVSITQDNIPTTQCVVHTPTTDATGNKIIITNGDLITVIATQEQWDVVAVGLCDEGLRWRTVCQKIS